MDLLIALFVGIVIGAPVSFFGGLVATRVIAFDDLRTELVSLVERASWPTDKPDEALGHFVDLSAVLVGSIALRFHAAGHQDAFVAVKEMAKMLHRMCPSGPFEPAIIHLPDSDRPYFRALSEDVYHELKDKARRLYPNVKGLLKIWPCREFPWPERDS